MKSIKLISLIFLILVLSPSSVSSAGMYSVEITESGDFAQITYCVSSEGGYYRLKSSSDTFLRSRYFENDMCVSYNEDKRYLYTLEKGVWVAFVTDKTGTVQSFRSFNVNPTPTTYPTAAPTYQPNPYPTYTAQPVPTDPPYQAPITTPVKPKIIPKPIAEVLKIKETPGFEGLPAIIGIMAVLARRKKE